MAATNPFFMKFSGWDQWAQRATSASKTLRQTLPGSLKLPAETSTAALATTVAPRTTQVHRCRVGAWSGTDKSWQTDAPPA